jgi:hypothetical protein
MGWYQTPGSTLKGIIEEITVPWQNKNVSYKVIAKCFRGAPTHKGILWFVGEQTHKDGTVKTYICCYLLEYWRQTRHFGLAGWAYKPMDEGYHPYYYNCPEKYLRMVPDTQCQEWRDEVGKYHSKRRAKLAVKRAKEVVTGF